MKIVSFILLLVITSCGVIKYKKYPKIGDNPYFEIDGKYTSKEEALKFDPNNVAVVTLYDGKDALEKYGEKGRDGVVLITSISLAREQFQNLFSSVSKEYAKVISEYNDTEIQYILNNKLLDTNYEGKLALIKEKNLKSIVIIEQEVLINKYNKKDKKIGVLIKGKIPKS